MTATKMIFWRCSRKESEINNNDSSVNWCVTWEKSHESINKHYQKI